MHVQVLISQSTTTAHIQWFAHSYALSLEYKIHDGSHYVHIREMLSSCRRISTLDQLNIRINGKALIAFVIL